MPLTRSPGLEPESWAYHGDDGHTYCCQASGKHYGPPYGTGDVIGCGINFRTGSAFFTKNGDNLGMSTLSRPIEVFLVCFIYCLTPFLIIYFRNCLSGNKREAFSICGHEKAGRAY